MKNSKKEKRFAYDVTQFGLSTFDKYRKDKLGEIDSISQEELRSKFKDYLSQDATKQPIDIEDLKLFPALAKDQNDIELILNAFKM